MAHGTPLVAAAAAQASIAGVDAPWPPSGAASVRPGRTIPTAGLWRWCRIVPPPCCWVFPWPDDPRRGMIPWHLAAGLPASAGRHLSCQLGRLELVSWRQDPGHRPVTQPPRLKFAKRGWGRAKGNQPRQRALLARRARSLPSWRGYGKPRTWRPVALPAARPPLFPLLPIITASVRRLPH